MKKAIDIKSLVIGVLATALFFSVIGAKSRHNANFDTITAKKIRIVNPKGKVVAVLGSAKGEGGLEIFNKYGKWVASVQANKDGDGAIVLFDRYGDFGWGMTGKR